MSERSVDMGYQYPLINASSKRGKFTEDAKASIIQPRSVWHHLDDDDE